MNYTELKLAIYESADNCELCEKTEYHHDRQKEIDKHNEASYKKAINDLKAYVKNKDVDKEIKQIIYNYEVKGKYNPKDYVKIINRLNQLKREYND